jgi:hypothetical protein
LKVAAAGTSRFEDGTVRRCRTCACKRRKNRMESNPPVRVKNNDRTNWH